MSLSDIFIDIYRRDTWGGGSGPGSTPENTKPYRLFLQSFIREKKISSVVDLGCGDWQFSRLIDWTGVNYLGVDFVPAVVKANQEKFGREGVRFIQGDILAAAIPPADLLIIKDVLQHLSIKNIQEFLPKLKSFQYVLITNCVRPKEKLNSEIAGGGFRPLDLGLPPFSIPVEPQLQFSNRRQLKHLFRRKWSKRVDLLQPANSQGRLQPQFI